jgi:hypothetical protein
MDGQKKLQHHQRCVVCKTTSQYRPNDESCIVHAKLDESSAAWAKLFASSSAAQANQEGQCKWCGEGPKLPYSPLKSFCSAGCQLHKECWDKLYAKIIHFISYYSSCSFILSGMCFCEEVVNQTVFIETLGLMTTEKG